MTNSFKYLGMKISRDRKKVVDDAKSNCSKFLHILRGKLNSSNEELAALIYGAFHRSLAVYYFTPLFSARLITRDWINNYEDSVMRKQIRLPKDISNNIIQKLYDNFATPNSLIVYQQAQKNRILVPTEQRNPTKFLKEPLKE